MTTTTARQSHSSQTNETGRQGAPCVPGPESSQPGERPSVRKHSGRRKMPTNPSSASALAMLTRQPIFAASVPQIHVGPRAADGSILVDDRASNRRFRVYTPRLNSQFRAGYRAGLWYLRSAGDADPSPRSPGFPTPSAAVDTLRAASRDSSRRAPSHGPRCRVIWS
jgi:hypothetical protein